MSHGVTSVNNSFHLYIIVVFATATYVLKKKADQEYYSRALATFVFYCIADIKLLLLFLLSP